MIPGTSRSPVRWLCAIVFLVYFLFSAGTIFCTDGSKRLAVAQQLIANGRTDIESRDRLPVGVDGKHYPQYAIGHSLAMIPFTLAGMGIRELAPSVSPEIVETAASFTNLVVTLLVVWSLVMFAGELGFSDRTAIALGLVYAFTTIAWQQSKDSFEHPLISLYFTALFRCLHRFAVTRDRKCLIAAGAALGVAVLTRYTTVLAGGAVALFLATLAARSSSPHRLRDGVTSIATVAVMTLPFVAFDLWFNYVRFGSPFETGQVQLHGALMAPASFFSGLFGLTLHWGHGLIPFNPVLLLALAGLPRFYARHRALAVGVIAVFLLHLGFYSALSKFWWDGGWTWGPRFFVDVMPMLILMGGPVFESVLERGAGRRAQRWAVALVVAVSALVQLESVLVNSDRNYMKKVLEVDGYSYSRDGIRDSLIHMQAESIGQISRNLWNGRGPSPGVSPGDPGTNPVALIDGSLSYGTFQMWWVYALHFHASKGLILAYLFATAAALAWAIRALRQSLAVSPGVSSQVSSASTIVCPCALSSSTPT